MYSIREEQPLIAFESELMFYPDNEVEFQQQPVPSTTMEVNIPVDKIVEVAEMYFDILENDPAPMPLVFRYVRPTEATLGWLRGGDGGIIRYSIGLTRKTLRSLESFFLPINFILFNFSGF